MMLTLVKVVALAACPASAVGGDESSSTSNSGLEIGKISDGKIKAIARKHNSNLVFEAINAEFENIVKEKNVSEDAVAPTLQSFWRQIFSLSGSLQQNVLSKLEDHGNVINALGMDSTLAPEILNKNLQVMVCDYVADTNNTRVNDLNKVVRKFEGAKSYREHLASIDKFLKTIVITYEFGTVEDAQQPQHMEVCRLYVRAYWRHFFCKSDGFQKYVFSRLSARGNEDTRKSKMSLCRFLENRLGMVNVSTADMEDEQVCTSVYNYLAYLLNAFENQMKIFKNMLQQKVYTLATKYTKIDTATNEELFSHNPDAQSLYAINGNLHGIMSMDCIRMDDFSPTIHHKTTSLWQLFFTVCESMQKVVFTEVAKPVVERDMGEKSAYVFIIENMGFHKDMPTEKMQSKLEDLLKRVKLQKIGNDFFLFQQMPSSTEFIEQCEKAEIELKANLPNPELKDHHRWRTLSQCSDHFAGIITTLANQFMQDINRSEMEICLNYVLDKKMQLYKLGDRFNNKCCTLLGDLNALGVDIEVDTLCNDIETTGEHEAVEVLLNHGIDVNTKIGDATLFQLALNAVPTDETTTNAESVDNAETLLDLLFQQPNLDIASALMYTKEKQLECKDGRFDGLVEALEEANEEFNFMDNLSLGGNEDAEAYEVSSLENLSGPPE